MYLSGNAASCGHSGAFIHKILLAVRTHLRENTLSQYMPVGHGLKKICVFI